MYFVNQTITFERILYANPNVQVLDLKNNIGMLPFTVGGNN